MMDTVPSPPPSQPSPDTNGVAATPFAAVDPVKVVDHLVLLLEAALGAKRDELEAPGSLLSKVRYSDTVQRCSRFALDTQVALYIQKDLAPTTTLDGENGAEAEERMFPSFKPSRCESS